MFAWFITTVAVVFTADLPPAVRYTFVVTSVGWVRADPDGVGTGWVADTDRRILVTCRHVVGQRGQVEVFFPHVESWQLVTARADYLGNRERLRQLGQLVAGRVIRTSDRSDLALVELESLPPGTRSLALAPPPVPDEPVWTIGNRHDLDTLWNLSAGPVRQTGRLTEGYFWQGTKLAAGASALLLQVPIAEGDSGGPVLDRRGRVVAVVSAVRTRTSLGTVGIAVEEVRQFLKRPAEDENPATRPTSIAARLTPATAWVRPTATASRNAGVLIDRDRRLVLTSAADAGSLDRVGVAFPLAVSDGRWHGEKETYADPVTLHLKETWRTGTVIARDERRDLALVQLDSLPAWAVAVPLAKRVPAVGEEVHVIGHPTGVEFLWVYAAGVVRQRGPVRLGRDETKVEALVLQLPGQGNSSGGPVANHRGELIGILAAKSGSQVGYSASLKEVRSFLVDPAARTAAGRLAKLDRTAIFHRADEMLQTNEPKQAAGEFEKILDVDPSDRQTRRRLAMAWATALEDAKAVRAFADVLRLDAAEFPLVAADVATHADRLHARNPAAAESWLRTALPALADALPPGADRDRLHAALRDARYPALRAALK